LTEQGISIANAYSAEVETLIIFLRYECLQQDCAGRNAELEKEQTGCEVIRDAQGGGDGIAQGYAGSSVIAVTQAPRF